MAQNLMIAHTQWANRPADQRFTSLADLYAAVHNRRMASVEANRPLIDITAEVLPQDQGASIVLARPGATRKVEPSHWAFGQLATTIGAPARYLRSLSPQLAVDNLNYGIKQAAKEKPEMKFMAIRTPDAGGIDTLQAVTSISYGRIFDAQVAQVALDVVDASGGKFFNPKAYNRQTGAPEPSGLYASDHDIFIFMIDGGSYLDAGPRAQLNRGFVMWNSEVGAAAFNWMTFLHNGVCGNHIIWGASQVTEGRIVHKSSAPGRFQAEALPGLLSYVNAEASIEVDAIKRAQDYLLPATDQAVIEWLKDRKFNGSEAQAAVEYAKQEEGDARTLWQIVQGLTASAREMAFIDARIDLEKRAGTLLKIVA